MEELSNPFLYLDNKLSQVLENQRILFAHIEKQEQQYGGYEFASRITGKKISTLRTFVSTKRIPVHGTNGDRVFWKEELLNWMSSIDREKFMRDWSIQQINKENAQLKVI